MKKKLKVLIVRMSRWGIPGWLGSYTHRHGEDGPYAIFAKTEKEAMAILKELVKDDYEPKRGDEELSVSHLYEAYRGYKGRK